MQQGKEPLRSFSDLMQFMKQSKPEPTTATDPVSSNSSADSTAKPASEPSPVEAVHDSDREAPSRGEHHPHSTESRPTDSQSTDAMAADSVATDANTTA
jgi:hypothetical protein